MLGRIAQLMSWWPVERAIQVACALGLFTLCIMSAGVVLGTPLWVVASMSAAQVLGAVAGLLFVISLAADAGAQRSKGP